MKRYPCRCNKCRGRKTLAKHPSAYLHQRYVTCGCGGELRVDTYRKRKEHKNPCSCLGYWFPHRPGGGIWCEKHTVGPTDQDYENRYK